MLQKYRFFFFSLLWVFFIVQFSYGVELTRTEEIAEKNKTYAIGTGITFNYVAQNYGIMIDSYHLFNSVSRPFDKALLRIGLGVNYDTAPIGTMPHTGFLFNVSIGYLYTQNQFHQLTNLRHFGTGVSLDYTMINTDTQGIGVSLYVVLNQTIVGLGGGIIIETGGMAPYFRTSIAITF